MFGGIGYNIEGNNCYYERLVFYDILKYVFKFVYSHSSYNSFKKPLK